MSKAIFNKVKTINKYPCVTIILPTYRTSPDNKQDSIILKNQISEVHNRLAEEFSKRDLTALQKNLDRIDEIDMNHNKEGLVIFINEDLFEYTRLLFKPEERVIIDDTFATRDLIRSMHKAENYFVLALGKDNVRLFEGLKEDMTEIQNSDFPFENKTLYSTNSGERAISSKEDNLIEEFFNRVDKAFLKVYAENPGDLILAGVERNVAHYKNIADKPGVIIGSISYNGDSMNAHELAKDAWPLMRNELNNRQADAISNLEKSVSENKFETDLQMIWKAINEGRADTLYAEKSYFQPVKEDNGSITPVDDHRAVGVIDDIVDEMAEITLQYGGKVVFLDDGSLEKYQQLALITRY